MSSPEQSHSSGEHSLEHRETAESQIEKLAKNHEAATELSPKDGEARAENARQEALENAISVESGGKEKEKPKDGNQPHRRGPIDKKTREKSYKQTIGRVQNDLPFASRTFSKIIHNKVIESTSETLANTIARPNAILSGAIAAFILTLVTYIVAKTLGYRLSGSETIVSFIIGWVIGLIYDYFRLLVSGKKS